MNKRNEAFDPFTQAFESVAVEIPNDTLPDPSAVTYYLFEKQRKVFLDQDVDYPVMEIIKLIMRWNQEDKDIEVDKRKPITLYIMSDGGSIVYAWSLIDAMMASKTPIITVNLGVAASSAALIFLAGSYRYMAPTATVIIHEGSAQMDGDASKLMDAAAYYKIEIKKMRDFILSRTNISAQVMSRRQKDDWYISATECLEKGICHKIIESLDEII